MDAGCTVSIMSKMQGGGKHRNKKNKVEKKPATNPQSQEPVRGQQEHDERQSPRVCWVMRMLRAQ